MTSRLLLLMALVALAGCRQNPYPNTGRFFLEEPQKTEPAPVADIDMPAILECEEGKSCSVMIRGYFGETGGTPKISFATALEGAGSAQDGLPVGAVYDADTETLTYTPDYSVVDPTKDPTRTYKVLNVEATLRKNEEPVTVYKRRSLLVTVRNTLRPLDVQIPSLPKSANEGDTVHGTLTVSSVDYPSGPFQLLIKNGPAGITSTVTGPNQFDVTYAIAYDTVSVNDTLDPTTGRYAKTFPVEYAVVLPSGEVQSVTSSLIAYDTRIAPVVSYPATLEQGPSVNFTIRVDDLNGERAPVVHLPESMPVGKLTLTEIPLTTPGLRAHLYDIKWTGIPATEAGKKFDFPFLVCGATSPTENTQCRNYVTEITIVK